MFVKRKDSFPKIEPQVFYKVAVKVVQSKIDFRSVKKGFPYGESALHPAGIVFNYFRCKVFKFGRFRDMSHPVFYFLK